MTPRVVATDLDGTIVRSDGTISTRTRDALAAAEKAGAMVVLVTGRPTRWLRGVADATGHRGLAVCSNGAVVFDLHTEHVVSAHPIDADSLRRVTAVLRAELPDLAFAVERVAEGFGHEPSYHPRWDSGDALVADLESLIATPVVKLLARHEEMSADDLLARARGVVDDRTATLTHSSRDGLLEICAAGITKASTLMTLCDRQGVSAKDVLAFGDMPNDLPMLEWAGHSVAVANAHPSVRAAVDEIAASNDEDGVAQVLARWF
jgi:Cof subfamily protein (haloacid dehalogenase superfamily)